jgi:hypothetical protein
VTEPLPTLPAEWADELEARTERAKSEILAHIERGIVPADVATFADLHESIDANELGGICEEPFYSLISGDEHDPSDASWAFGVLLQDAIHRWLRGGRRP